MIATLPTDSSPSALAARSSYTRSTFWISRKWLPAPSGENPPVLVVEGGAPADRKPVSPMDVRHRHRLADDPRHRRHVGDLFRSPVLAEQREQRLIDEDEAVRPHFTFVGPRDLVSKAVHLFQGTVPAFDHWHREEEQTKECT